MSIIHSVFDDPDASSFTLWNLDFPGSQFHSEKIRIEGPMTKKASGHGSFEQKWFVLTDKHIWYRTSESSDRIRGWMDLEWVRIEFIPKISEIYTKSPQTKKSPKKFGFR